MKDALTLAEAERTLPRGRHALPQEEVARYQSGRLLQAMAEAVAERGYPATTVADVLKRARVSRAAFYELFSDKEHCFLTAYERASNLHLRRISAAVDEAEDWLSALHAGHRAYIDVLVAAPPFAHAFIVDVVSAGPRALELRERIHGRYVESKRDTHAAARAAGVDVPDVPDEIFWGVVAASESIVSAAIRRGELAGLPGFVPALVYLDLSTFVGESFARAELSAG